MVGCNKFWDSVLSRIQHAIKNERTFRKFVNLLVNDMRQSSEGSMAFALFSVKNSPTGGAELATSISYGFATRVV